MRPTNKKSTRSLLMETLEARENPAPLAFSVQSDGDDSLYQIDLGTGVATRIGTGVGFADVEALAYQPGTNILYAVDDATDTLITINTTTGIGTAVGTITFSGVLPPAQINPGIRFDSAGILYMVTDFEGTSTGTLYQFTDISPGTVAASSVGNQGISLYGLAFQGNTPFALGDTQLATVNLGTGLATPVGNLTNVIGTQGDLDNFTITNTLWGITDGERGPSQTFTVDSISGIATVRAGITVNGVATSGFEGLAISPDQTPVPPPPGPPPGPPPVSLDGQLVVGAGAGGGPNVRIFDATTGALIRTFLAYDASMSGGVNVAVGDVTGDGIAEIITAPASIGGSDIRIFDGSGNLLYNFIAYNGFYGGASVAVGDVDGDRVGDIITGAGKGGGPHVRVFRGKDFQPIRDFLAYDPRFREGIAVAAGDFNRNDRADIITGAGPGGGADVRIFTDGNALQMTAYLTQEPLYRGGISVAAGDVDGDGIVDLILGTAEGEPIVTVNQVGATLTVKRQISPYGRFQGGTRVGTFSRSDGTTDITTGAGPGGGPHVRILSGRTGQAKLDFLAFGENFEGGANVSIA